MHSPSPSLVHLADLMRRRLTNTEGVADFGPGALVRTQIFLTKEHSKAESGHESPGPVYELKSSVGKQVSSKNESPAAFSFGTSDRFEKMSAGKMREVAPGPGQYKKPGCYGNQVRFFTVFSPPHGISRSPATACVHSQL
jgi:hypothetical protein